MMGSRTALLLHRKDSDNRFVAAVVDQVGFRDSNLPGLSLALSFLRKNNLALSVQELAPTLLGTESINFGTMAPLHVLLFLFPLTPLMLTLASTKGGHKTTIPARAINLHCLGRVSQQRVHAIKKAPKESASPFLSEDTGIRNTDRLEDRSFAVKLVVLCRSIGVL